MVKFINMYYVLQVNELKDSATQIEDEIQKTQQTMYKNKVDVARLKGQLDALDTKDPKYVRF